MDPAHHARQFAAEDWDWWHVARRRVLARVLDAALDRRPGQAGSVRAVLDVGCGTGGTTAHLAAVLRRRHAGAVMAGCDVAPEALALAASRGTGLLVRASAEALPFAPASFDVVLALDVLEHHADDGRVAAELRRVLRPHGLLLATVPAFACLWGPHDVLSHHHRRYRLPGLVSLLVAAGLRVVRATYFNTVLFPVVAGVQAARRALRRGAPVLPASDLPSRMPRAVNAVLRGLFALEGPWVARRSLPWGVSALALAVPAGGSP